MNKLENRKNFKTDLTTDAIYVGRYGFPKIRKNLCIPHDVIPFNFAKSERSPSNKWVHFFVDDYQFERVWNFPSRYLPLLSRFEGIISTNFSMFDTMSTAQRIWNCYRNRVMDYWMQNNGLNVIPVAEWAEYTELDWCLDGLPVNSTIAVGLYGCSKSSSSKYGLLKGIEKICLALSPSALICYGNEISSVNSLCQHVIWVENYCKTIKERAYNGWK